MYYRVWKVKERGYRFYGNRSMERGEQEGLGILIPGRVGHGLNNEGTIKMPTTRHNNMVMERATCNDIR
jgi:hypothetical protein